MRILGKRGSVVIQSSKRVRTLRNGEGERNVFVDLLDDLSRLVSNGGLAAPRLQEMVTAARLGMEMGGLSEHEANVFRRLRMLSAFRLRNVQIEFLEDDAQVVRVAPLGVLTKRGYR